MNHDTTDDLIKDLSVDEKLNLILAELRDNRAWRATVDERLTRFDERLTRVEAIVEERARDTRPMLELINKNVADLAFGQHEINQAVAELSEGQKEIKRELARIRVRLDEFGAEQQEMRRMMHDFDRRLVDVEEKVFV